MYYRQTDNLNERVESKSILVLMSIYMSSIPLFTAHGPLNVISQIFFVLAFGGCALYMVLRGVNFRYDTSLMWFAGFILWCFIGILWSKDRDISVSMIITLIQLFALFLIMYSYISAYENIGSFVVALLIAGFICSLVVIGYYGLGEYIKLMLEGQRLGAPITNVNIIGLYSATTAIICFFYGYLKGKRWSYILMVLPLITAFGSGSRKALVMIALGVLFLIFMKYRESISIKGFFKLLAMLCVIVVIIYWMTTMPIFEGAFERFEQMLGMDGTVRDGSTRVRMRMIQAGWDYFKLHPYTGVGIGNSGYITLEYIGYTTYLHNNFIEILASVGVFGFLIYYAMYAYLVIELYRVAIRANDDYATLMLIIIVTQLILSYGAVLYYDKMTYIYAAMAAATVSIGKRKIFEMELEENDKNTEKNQEVIE